MVKPRHKLIRSIDPKDKEAIALIDGRVPLKVGAVGRHINLDQTIGRDAILSLCMAEALWRMGARREAYKWCVRSAIEAFEAMGVPAEQQFPIRRLLQALDNPDRGAFDPDLQPIPLNHRRPETVAVWAWRACLAVAMEAQMKLGCERMVAAALIARKAMFARAKPKTIANWRDQLLRGKGPPDAATIFETGRQILQHASDAASVENRFLELALRFSDHDSEAD
jgi:hypothetical protein